MLQVREDLDLKPAGQDLKLDQIGQGCKTSLEHFQRWRCHDASREGSHCFSQALVSALPCTAALPSSRKAGLCTWMMRGNRAVQASHPSVRNLSCSRYLHYYLSYPLSAAAVSTKARGASGHLLERSQPEVPTPPQLVTPNSPSWLLACPFPQMTSAHPLPKTRAILSIPP